MSAFRIPALVLIPALLVGGAVYDAENRPEAEPSSVRADAGLATVAPADARSSVWYCPAAALGNDDQVVVTNLTTDERVGTVTYLPALRTYGEGVDTAVRAEITLLPGEQLELVPAEQIPGEDAVAAVVEFDGGAVMVEHSATVADLGATDRQPCATEAASNWYFPVGATVSDPGVSAASQQLVLLNPFPDPAVVDITFDTSNGSRDPSNYEGLVVAGRSARLLDVNEEVANVERASAFVRARSGRLIVDRVLAYDGAVERQGLSVAAGATRPTIDVHLPGGTLAENATTSVFIMNPDPDFPAEVDIEVVASEVAAIEPFQRTVPADGVIEVVIRSDVSAEPIGGDPGRVLEGVRSFSLVVRSLNDVPVVAERRDLVLASADTAPGLTTVVGSPVTATRWSTVVSSLDPEASALVIQNPSFDSIVTLTLTAGDADPVEFELSRGGRLSVPFSEIGGGPISIEASGPVVMERQVVGLTSRSSALGVPDAVSVASDTTP
ncbi:MAG: DUF5719 family protein [Acidimicrobiales bacterium]